ncbi:MAG: GspH/FimT family pseudopilin [Colwellia sp.]
MFKASLIRGVTLVELMVSISVTSILASIAIPNFSSFMIQMRVDNEITQLYRLLLTARNQAINMQLPVTICPLNENNHCDTQWHNEISVFIDLNHNQTYEPSKNEPLIQTKAVINIEDKLQYGKGRSRIIYSPTGRTTGWGSNGTFKYCPKAHTDKARAIRVATSGRVYISTDFDNDGKDETRNGAEIKCRE